jgi:hypothetical protein
VVISPVHRNLAAAVAVAAAATTASSFLRKPSTREGTEVHFFAFGRPREFQNNVRF